MGSKNGKYQVATGQTIESTLSDIVSDRSKKSIQQEQTTVSQCLRRNSFSEASLNNASLLSIVWLDHELQYRLSYVDVEVQLKNINHYVRLFNHVEHCERYIRQIGKSNNNHLMKKEYVLVIISNNLAPTIIPYLEPLNQVKYIYVFGKSKSVAKAHQQSLSRCKKVSCCFALLHVNRIVLVIFLFS